MRTTVLLLAGVLLTSCGEPRVWNVPSANHNSRVQHLVLHFTSENHAESLRLLTQPTDAPVSAHYLIPDPRDPGWGRDEVVVLRLVAEERRAWHAGRSHWAGTTALNDSSIGIEIVNESRCETSNGMNAVRDPDERRCVFQPYDDRQIDVLIALLQGILERHPDIDPEDVVAHADIAPDRKVDPGPLFPWARLHEAGIGAWYETEQVMRIRAGLAPEDLEARSVQRALAAWGYGVTETALFDTDTRFALEAFQMHFRPTRHDGVADAETVAILHALIARYRPERYASLTGAEA
ncbi:MAG: N-acetylmuramoyl-L-alanine amidase [Pseudomonadales bacterium]|jgi:N-acetyl-anhydromuramyl-L-alanine amidase AmpD|nr:N-acetylmuramoyl-L-alanine amidase [Pseudomonadales bacterium]